MTPLRRELLALPAPGISPGAVCSRPRCLLCPSGLAGKSGCLGFTPRHPSGCERRGSGAGGWGRRSPPTKPRHPRPWPGAVLLPGATRTGGSAQPLAPGPRCRQGRGSQPLAGTCPDPQLSTSKGLREGAFCRCCCIWGPLGAGGVGPSAAAPLCPSPGLGRTQGRCGGIAPELWPPAEALSPPRRIAVAPGEGTSGR